MDDAEGLADVRATLLEIVSNGMQTRPGPVYLTYVGSEFARKKNAAFEQYMNVLSVQNKITIPISSRKMIPFIENYCSDIFSVKRDSASAETISLMISGEAEAALGDGASSSNHKFQKSVWAAFIRPLPDGFRRFLNIDTHGFSDYKRKPSSGIWLEISRDLITPTPIDQPVPGPLVQARIGEWAAANGLDVESLVDQAPQASFTRSRLGLPDLLAIIGELPPELASRWKIPADILLFLGSSGSRE